MAYGLGTPGSGTEASDTVRPTAATVSTWAV